MNKKYKDRNWLYENYVEKEIKILELAKDCGTTTDTIYHWLDKYQIPRRTKKAIDVKCLNCDKVFKKTYAEIRKGNLNHYCSQKCCKEL